MSKHNGCCSFCGTSVDREFVTCTGCGATWTPVVGLLGHALMVAVLPCGVLAALTVGVQTRSPGLGLAALLGGGLGVMFLALSAPLRTWLWVRR